MNRTYGRSGTLWEGRFRSCPVQDDHHLLACYRYIELNPVRAGIVRHPAEYPWSSYRANAAGRGFGYLVPHPCYLELAAEPAGRAAAYRDLVVERLPPALLEDIRSSTSGDYALGDAGFKRRLEAAVGRPAERGRAGRPSNRADAEAREAASARASDQLRPA
ncbi:MAG: transposase [Halofilum sp. (in: g-proteobacteria)]|nr:transposase [Halofilum sp. (in: g-proteobacteria)]